MTQHYFRNHVSPRLTFAAALGVLALTAGSAFAATAGQTNLGPEDESKQISVTVWLNPHNKAALDTAVQQMYDKESASYHHFLTLKQFNEQYAPTAKEAGVVREYLAAHNLKVKSTEKNNRFVVAEGRVGDAQAAFNTKINRVMVNGEVHHANTAEASVTGEAAPLVATVQGLSDLKYRALVKPSVNPESGVPYEGVSPSAVGADGLFYSADCLRGAASKVFKTDGGFPEAFYAGNLYGASITNAKPPNLPPCGYDAAEIQEAYGLKPLYKKGLDGAGQTIVIVDAFGSNSIVSDANLFSQLNGLPALTPSNFQIVEPTGPATCTATNGCIAGNWQYETTLDVEWAHAIAPNANIVLVLGADNSFTNLDLSNLAAIQNGYGNVISNSFGISEIALKELDPSELVVENGIAQIAAALGISLNVSTGDSGDELITNNADFGINAVSVNANADSPYATAVGGTSTFLDAHNNIKLQTGWGLNLARIANANPNPPVIPPLLFGFQSGSGGGTSVVFAKPKFQKSLKGKFRQVPDISMNADPQTGNEVVVSPDGVPAHGTQVLVFGGTSLSCPMFSGYWAIANQAAGAPLGQAAPILYELSEGAIIDVNVTPVDTLLNVSGLIIDPPNSPIFESQSALAQPLENTKLFVSALYNSPSSTRWDVLTFGTDSSLVTGPGWDNVTGLGTPNGATFINDVVKAVQ
ncbi:S53 family peptidase [Tunturiibacter gelidoferens]|uniref:Subtilase family serine protease n=1 Tax=Tunturiibacter gelidiferens TaxID=3069689 RepID=A0ACC5NZB6_9BACT|nr:S53 family peptidase [Edaphobacter lichenicola]MBB5339791.1 subtilase family serine protease [Edaphobacter lichenicola]